MFIVPLTIFGGIYMLDDRKYYFISLMIIFEIMLPFFINLEREKAKAEKLVVIASFAAVAAVGRIAFYMIPQFKPMSAVIIIAGICFGAESGFLAGALSAFASNMFFGQGPWTPWQMFCLGMIGFISGLLSRKIKYNKLFLCIYGFFAVMIIYGGIINFSALIYEPEINISAIAAVYANAFVFDLINAFSTAFFLWIISEPLIRKTERIKYKYGLY
ncbi:MAG: ECF transporter S component [Oscillospiraceae bacterium]|nr:ECF transporter S component [Oscillospiraceae bacterium]